MKRFSEIGTDNIINEMIFNFLTHFMIIQVPARLYGCRMIYDDWDRSSNWDHTLMYFLLRYSRLEHVSVEFNFGLWYDMRHVSKTRIYSWWRLRFCNDHLRVIRKETYLRFCHAWHESYYDVCAILTLIWMRSASTKKRWNDLLWWAFEIIVTVHLTWKYWSGYWHSCIVIAGYCRSLYSTVTIMDSARVLMNTVNDLERWILTGVSKSVCSLIES